METNSCRYERKFLVTGVSNKDLETVMKLHPSLFLEIYQSRHVNNLYFDSLDMESFCNNVNGVSQRLKVRIRWYGNLFGKIEKPVLELKRKNGFVGSKELFPLTPFVLDENFEREVVSKVFNESDIPLSLRSRLSHLEVKLLNRFERKYFQSVDKLFRITLDSKLEAYAVNRLHNVFVHKHSDPTVRILELKYDTQQDEKARKVSNYFRFRMTKISKYVHNTEQLHR